MKCFLSAGDKHHANHFLSFCFCLHILTYRVHGVIIYLYNSRSLFFIQADEYKGS